MWALGSRGFKPDRYLSWGDILATLWVDCGSAGALKPQTVKAGACVLFRDGQLPGCRWPDFNFSHLPLQQLLLMGFFLLLCAAAGSGLSWEHMLVGACLGVLRASGAAGAWGWKRNEGCGDYLWACSPSAQFQETWKIRQLIAKPVICLNTTQMLHNVYYLNFSILLEHCPLGITGYKSVAPCVCIKGGNVPSGCCSLRWRLWVAECWFAVYWWFLVCTLWWQ